VAVVFVISDPLIDKNAWPYFSKFILYQNYINCHFSWRDVSCGDTWRRLADVLKVYLNEAATQKLKTDDFKYQTIKLSIGSVNLNAHLKLSVSHGQLTSVLRPTL
jgi:hypothetical protein